MSFTKKIFVGVLSLIALSPLSSMAADLRFEPTTGLTGTLTKVQTFINGTLVPFIIGIAVLMFIFGLFKFITAGGDDKALTQARGTIIWGIVIIAVMISTWGLVKLVANTFGLNGQGSNPTTNDIPKVIPQI